MDRVLLVDDHDLVRDGVRRLLEDTGEYEVVGEARDGESAIAMARRTRPDIILMDLNMPGMGGLEATRKLLRLDPRLKVVAVSVHDDGPLPERMLEVGAVGYITKGSGIEEVLLALAKVRSGERYVSADVAQHMVLGRHDASRAPLSLLSARELEVMTLVSKGRNLKEISETLCLSPKTVSTYRARIFEKLQVRSDVELTHLAMRHGLVEPGAAL